MDGIHQAVELLGGQRQLAAATGASPQAVSSWVVGTRRISVEYALKVEAATKGAVTCASLRPDIFGGLSLKAAGRPLACHPRSGRQGKP